MKKINVLFAVLFCVAAALVLSTCASIGAIFGSSATEKASYFTGDGGKGMSIAILAPKGTGIAENQNYLPTLVQGELVSNFSGYSAISVLDRVSLDEQYAELLSGYYDDDAKAGQDLGHLPPTEYIMSGSITKTATGYALQMRITKTADKMTAASYSGTCTFAELDNLSGIRRASLDLLEKMGITPTERAKTELAGAATQQSVNAQTALAQGIVSQKSGTTVESLIYYYQAAAFDPSLLEAAGRASVMTASITSGNIGADARNDIQWRKDWLARLEECERYFDTFFKTSSPPYQFAYSTDLERGAIDYKTETIPLSFKAHLFASPVWFNSVERALNAVLDGLNATGRKKDWGLTYWPSSNSVSKLNPFKNSGKTFAVTAELLNDKGRVIASQNIKLTGTWKFDYSYSGKDNVVREVYIVRSNSGLEIVKFGAVKADDISDVITIRIARVDGVDAQTAAKNGTIQITTPGGYWGEDFGNPGGYWGEYFGNKEGFKFANGRVSAYSYYASYSKEIVIPDTIWGEPVTDISENVIGEHTTSVTLPANVTLDYHHYYYDMGNGRGRELSSSYNAKLAITYNRKGKKAGTYVRSILFPSMWSLK